ncbi:hypothetical protein MKW94_019822 [Papaver nudicaule]|uniref:Uncharacterized protein n=1 Tax=Papaver nudicaule TaxID=74823 RepID=A0AA41S116_PAPNU|nr:hypothetical protein [Papaver nudicaule]
MVFLCCYEDVHVFKRIEKDGERLNAPHKNIGKFASKVKNVITTAKHPKPEKKVQTQTSILRTALSKIVCVPKEPIVDIDTADVNNPLAVVEYVMDIYKYYKLTERPSQVCGYMDLQNKITESMRMELVDWLIYVHNRFRLTPETLYLTVNIVDRYLALNLLVREKELQLVGITAMLIASKYEENLAPAVDDFVDISDETYTRKQILDMEMSILGKLRWNLTIPTTYHFLVRFIKAAAADKVMENLVFYLAELGLMHYAMTKYCPSMLAASAVYAAKCTLNRSPYWNETLKHYTGFSECHLIECAKQLLSIHSEVAEQEFQALYNKYSTFAHHIVALLPAAQALGC